MELIEILIELIFYAAINESANRDIRMEKLNVKIREGLNVSEKELYLFLIILMYLFIENDGKFTLKEKKLIKKELKNKKKLIKIKDYKLYKSVIYKKYSLEKVINEITRCEYDQFSLSMVMRNVKSLFSIDDSYRKAISKLDSSLYNIV